MSLISSAGNLYFVYQFIKKLVTPFDQTEAFKLGIIDENGKILKKRSSLKTQEEKEAYTMSDTLIFNLKKILAKVPGGGTKFGTFAAALFLLKEDKEARLYYDGSYLEKEFYRYLQECKNNPNEVEYIIEQVETHRIRLDEQVNEEGLAVGGGNIAGLGVEHPTKTGQAEPGVMPKKRKKFAGSDVFKVEPNIFMKARFGKKKYAKYEDYVGNDETGQEIREYGLKNPGKPIIIQDSLTGAMLYLRYGKK